MVLTIFVVVEVDFCTLVVLFVENTEVTLVVISLVGDFRAVEVVLFIEE